MTYKLPELKLHDIVAVHWFDAYQLPEASGDSKSLLDGECRLCDVGFFIGYSEKYVVIATETQLGDEDEFRHIHHIPKVNVTQIDKIGRHD